MSHKQLQAGEHLRRAIVELAKAGDLLAEDPEVRGSQIHYTIEANLDSLLMLQGPLLANLAPQGSC